MISGNDIQRNLNGAWRLMLGKRDGLRAFDLSADGFWDSFFAIALALPAMMVSWIGVTGDIMLGPVEMSGLGLMLRLAVIDLSAWVLPLVVLIAVAPKLGLGNRVVPYVIATNWGSVILSWMMLPASLVRLLLPDATDLATLVSFVLFLLAMALSWRLTNHSIGKGPAIATAVFVGMFALSLMVLFSLQSLLGISAPAA
ncbi:transporter [Oryzicola mucosus]|uniref:Transporter n=1 Tax=Oryzicola mucosus TaxID=2767425 RepID=A0A8J6PQT4_9HYPH|nr:transporter [Oryzicola mucosus]MBD0413354.1 transporter [Oryzicola mucosus]